MGNNFRCEVCGQFVSVKDADRAGHYGGYTDLEPPELHYFCPKCAAIEKAEAIEAGRVLDIYYTRPTWHIEAEKIIKANNEST